MVNGFNNNDGSKNEKNKYNVRIVLAIFLKQLNKNQTYKLM